MIILESGISVGKLDEGTLELDDVRSSRLQQLVDDWRKNGFKEPAAAEIPDDVEPRPVCAMTFVTIPFEKSSPNFIAHKIAHKLLIAGFEVQRDS